MTGWPGEEEATADFVPGPSLSSDALARKLRIAEQALRDITRCDYRGNEPHEQMIARLALADLERVR